MRKRVSTLRKLIVVNGFKHFIMILLVSWDTVSKTTVHKYMNRELQLYSICRRKRPAYHRGLAHKIFPNLWKRNFSPEWPNRVWCTDFTYMTLTNGTMRYHCSIIDLYDRSVVAGENSSFITSSLAVRTFEKALSSAKATSQNLILHSDQGSQFTSAEFVQHCRKLGISQSMSRASVWQCADGALLQYLKDRTDLSVSFWNRSRTGLCRFRVCLRLVQSGTPTHV